MVRAAILTRTLRESRWCEQQLPNRGYGRELGRIKNDDVLVDFVTGQAIFVLGHTVWAEWARSKSAWDCFKG